MTNKLNQIKEENPDLDVTPELEDNSEAYDKLHSLKALYDTEGGKVLAHSLLEDAVAQVHFLRGNYANLSHIQLITAISKMDVCIDTAKALINAEAGMDLIDAQIKETLSE